jgi:hypothetical protein
MERRWLSSVRGSVKMRNDFGRLTMQSGVTKTNRITTMVEQEVSCEALVLGGEPAGPNVATLLAWRGCDVLMLDKSKHRPFLAETDVTD